MDPLVRWEALGQLDDVEEDRRPRLVAALCYEVQYGPAGNAYNRELRALLADKTRALIRHDRILRGE